MAIIRQLTPDLIYTGVNDRRIALFENVYPVSAGVSYNSYVLRDRDTVIFDTADGGFTDKYLQNVEAALEGADPSYLVVHHMEPDHSASIKALADKYPSMKIILNAKTKAILANYFAGLDERTVCVKDGEEMCVGKHTLLHEYRREVRRTGNERDQEARGRARKSRMSSARTRVARQFREDTRLLSQMGKLRTRGKFGHDSLRFDIRQYEAGG